METPLLLGSLVTVWNLFLVLVGFSLIIVIHEMGHFVAARWAGIRVLAFAVGFGPALASYRRGLGWRAGSSEPEYKRRLASAAEAAGVGGSGSLPAPGFLPGVSPTEYRLNGLPFGGYVKMLGQEDVGAAVRGREADNFQSVPVWKRMVVISAGVAANVITAAALFVIVFMVGLRTEPPVVGMVAPDSPAASATAAGATERGLKPGDRIVSIRGRAPNTFHDAAIATAMARRRAPIEVVVERPGVPDPLVFSVTPREDPGTRMLQIGIGPALSGRILKAADEESRAKLASALARRGLPGVGSDMRIAAIDDRAGEWTYLDIAERIGRSGGGAAAVTFVGDDGREARVSVRPVRELQTTVFAADGDRAVPAAHLLGLFPVMRVEEVTEGGKRAGLEDGDVFARVGEAEWPSLPEGIAQVRSHARATVRVEVLRGGVEGGRLVDLGDVAVSRDGTIGFYPGDTAAESAIVTRRPGLALVPGFGGAAEERSAANIPRGSVITAIDGVRVGSLADAAPVVIAAVERARAAGGERVVLAVEHRPAGETPAEAADSEGGGSGSTTWGVSVAEAAPLGALGWVPPIGPEFFQTQQFLLKADNPARALTMGLQETQRVMLSTYLTFARLIQGSVKVEHLKGPVGIATIGTSVAKRGPVWLLFFLALISVNLAVVNFLPIPIADGGHFVFLSYEQVTGRPVSAAVLNIATLAGLLLIVGVFLLVTYNDIMSLIRG